MSPQNPDGGPKLSLVFLCLRTKDQISDEQLGARLRGGGAGLRSVLGKSELELPVGAPRERHRKERPRGDRDAPNESHVFLPSFLGSRLSRNRELLDVFVDPSMGDPQIGDKPTCGLQQTLYSMA